jgi:hypothetical protein
MEAVVFVARQIAGIVLPLLVILVILNIIILMEISALLVHYIAHIVKMHRALDVMVHTIWLMEIVIVALKTAYHAIMPRFAYIVMKIMIIT